MLWLTLGEKLVPDSGLYVAHSGTWYYPSPVGRFIGRGGWWALEFSTIIGGMGIVLAIGYFSSHIGGRPGVAAWILALSPVGLYLQPNSIDPIAGFLVCVWWGTRHGRSSYRPTRIAQVCGALSGALGALTHVAMFPIVAYGFLRTHRGLAILSVFFGGILLIVLGTHSAYGHVWSRPHVSLWDGLLTGIVGYATVALYRRVFLGAWPTRVIVSLCAIGGMEAAIQGHMQVRYELVPVILGLATSARAVRTFTLERTATNV